jgi:hypothetical protein
MRPALRNMTFWQAIQVGISHRASGIPRFKPVFCAFLTKKTRIRPRLFGFVEVILEALDK